MKKNQIIVINPISINIMKAICNSLISNLVEIIIIGNREIIKELCYKVNININVFRIIHCNNEKEMLFKLKQYQEKVKIDGIIIDELKEHKYKEIIKCEYLCHMIDFGVFKKSVCLLHNSCKVNIINDLTDNLLKNLRNGNLDIVIASINNNIKEDTLEFNIEDFYYDILDKKLKINVEYSLQAERKEDLFERVDESKLESELSFIDNFLDEEEQKKDEVKDEIVLELPKEKCEDNSFKEDSKPSKVEVANEKDILLFTARNLKNN